MAEPPHKFIVTVSRPEDRVRIVAEMKEALGRDATIDGPLRAGLGQTWSDPWAASVSAAGEAPFPGHKRRKIGKTC